MITFDGDRSRKRAWFGKKLLRTIREIDVPSKAVTWEGFRFTVWQSDDLDGGRVVAPMGAIVACSTQDGIKIATADHWLGAFDSLNDLHVSYYLTPTGSKLVKVFAGATAEEMIEDGNQIIKFRPMVGQAPIGGTLFIEYSGNLGLMPHKTSEGVWLISTDHIFLDLNGNGVADHPKYICESALSLYSAGGSNLGGRRGFDIQMENQIEEPYRFFQQLSPERMVEHFMAWPDIEDGKVVVTRDFEYPNYGITYLNDILPQEGMSAELWSILTDTYIASGPIGTYCFEMNGVRTTFYAVDASDTGQYWAGSANTPLQDYFDAHPEDAHYHLFYVMKVGEDKHIVTSTQFIDLLDSLVDDSVYSGGEIIWNKARLMLEQLTTTPPASHNYGVPFDSYAFHDHDGGIIVWTRKYGAVRFSTAGLVAAPGLVFPLEVTSEDGVQPTITYAGTFDEVPVYVCVCTKKEKIVSPDGVNVEIKAVYTGSPYTGWTALTAPGAEYTLVHVRPVSVSPAVFLLGVVKTEGQYFFAVYQDNAWRVMGKLPFAVGAADHFSTCLFGDGKQVQDLLAYPTHPVIAPQTPIGPYNLYAAGLP